MIEGTSDRLRPVLLTALLAMLGLLPMALSHEIGSETQRPFAVVIIGGLFTALLVTLLALPVLYGRILRVQVDPTTHSPKDVEVAS
jgi:cobalt-zinc-cadmium resistance protein CzcA